MGTIFCDVADILRGIFLTLFPERSQTYGPTALA
jgi:hypothetical protein